MVEDQEKVILLDPGKYSYESKALDIKTLKQLDIIAITHQHSDHMYIPWIKEIVKKFPHVEIITNPSASKLLQQEGLKVNTQGNDIVSLQPLPHEKVFDTSIVVENCAINLFNKFTTVGDSFGFSGQTEIIAFPIVAPWGSLTEAMNAAKSLKTKTMIPIHDYHWKDEFRKEFYVRCHEYLSQFGIDFKAIETGDIIEI